MTLIVARYFAILCLAVMAAPVAHGESPDVVERHVKSAFIYQFTKYITWPKEDGDFVVTVIGDDDLLKVLSGVTENKAVANRAIKVRSANWNSAGLDGSEIIVLPKAPSPNFKAIIEKLKDK